MTTYFDNLSKSFVDVPLEPGVNTADFLEASRGFVTIFDLFNSSAFVVVQKDLNGNIAKIQTRLDADPVNSATLEGLLAEEAKGSNKTATQGLLWLLRGLEFTLIGLQLALANPTEELSPCFKKSYDGTLKKYHNFIVQGVFNLAMKACPYRATFFEKLGSPYERVEEEGKKYLDALDVIVKRMKALYEEKGYGRGL